MKRMTFVIIILLLGISYANSNQADHWEKVRQMDELAERFRAETGFTGEINPNGALSQLAGFRGNFADIPFSADDDTLAFRQACDRIIEKLIPYTLATRAQLSKSRISRFYGQSQTEYHQIVNGYRVENGGLILISYDPGRYRFSISNGTVELPDEPLGEIIVESEAYQIALDLYKQTELYNPKNPIHSRTIIVYKSRLLEETPQPYRLCWKVTFPSISYYIDARSKHTFSEGYVIVDQW